MLSSRSESGLVVAGASTGAGGGYRTTADSAVGAGEVRAGGLTDAEREELDRIRDENRRLWAERDVLRKGAAIETTESGRNG
ncbi:MULTISPECIES: hypothetical protein [unclassified Frankia]|uniref:hypothetical protein n=1 Tax=unclassified Frankia TaxID=2632575 RepID=UPI002AD56E50|nr:MULTISPECIES: hypothetical protein [unclassified Frankia]